MSRGNNPALAVMARWPAPGQVKTRLRPCLTAGQAAGLYRALLLDAMELAASAAPYAGFVAYAPDDAESLFRELKPPALGMSPQGGGDLGQRMAHVQRQLFQRGFSPVVIVGSDLPMLSARHLDQALRALADNDVCLGPAADGGYYLIGSNAPRREIFLGIPWGTSPALEATLRAARAAGSSVGLLEECGDIDTAQDLRRLAAIVDQAGVPGAPRAPRHTEAAVRALILCGAIRNHSTP